MRNKRIYFAVLATANLVPLAFFMNTFSAAPLPKPETYAGSMPSARPPKELAVFVVVTGVNHRVTAFGYRGGSLFERRDFAMAGTLVKHPQGRPAYRHRVWPQHRRAISDLALHCPRGDALSRAADRRRPDAWCRLRPTITACNSLDPFPLGSR